MNASIMITCLGDLLFPEVGVAMVKLLRRLGVTVDELANAHHVFPTFGEGVKAAAEQARVTIAA